VIKTEIDANPGILFQDADLLPISCSMHVNDIIPESKIHRNDVGQVILIHHGQMAALASVDDIKNLFFFGYRMVSHQWILNE